MCIACELKEDLQNLSPDINSLGEESIKTLTEGHAKLMHDPLLHQKAYGSIYDAVLKDVLGERGALLANTIGVGMHDTVSAQVLAAAVFVLRERERSLGKNYSTEIATLAQTTEDILETSTREILEKVRRALGQLKAATAASEKKQHTKSEKGKAEE